MARKVGKPLKFNSPEEMKIKINEYFDECEKEKQPLTITGLALALDTTRRTLLDYEKEVDNIVKQGMTDEERKEYSHTIKKAKEIIHNFAEAYLYSGKNVAGAIFNLKNNYGWVDRKEIEVDAGDKLLNLINRIHGKENSVDQDNREPGADGIRATEGV